MAEAKLNLAFLWHQHQPFYKNSRGYYHMPWVRFHSTKDYLELLLILKEFPQIKQNINLVPSLLYQVEDYAHHGGIDSTWMLSEIPPENLTPEQKQEILENFFLANVRNMIKPYRRYYDLYLKYKYESRYPSIQERVNRFSNQDFRDLQVWYNLTWIGIHCRQRERLRMLFDKGQNFTEGDKQILWEETRQILAEIVPTHKAMWESGQIELSTSPFFHPILPLLIDNTIARESAPEVSLPNPPFSHPEDAQAQLEKGLAYFEQLFGRRPEGLWPSEGSVSEEAAQLIARNNLRWIATDEAILAKSLQQQFQSNRIYQPHLFQGKNKSITIFFRDHYLSDTIGFVYSNWDEDRAVDDFLSRLHAIRKRVIDEAGEAALANHITSVILDGENCWEYYPNDGRTFLKKLFTRLSEDPLIRSVTFSEFLNENPSIPNLYKLYPGSWINSNFQIWIGSEEDNKAWDLLRQAREFLVAKEEEGVLPPEQLEEAWQQIYIAEGSDWCWWYGDEHSSRHDLEFDQLFREHLMRVYEIGNGEVPASLYQTIKQKHFDRFSSVRPMNFIHPVIDGKVSHFYEWSGAAVYESSASRQTAMHQVSRTIDKFYLGFDEQAYYFRIDFAKKPDLLFEYVIAAKTPRQITVVFSPLRGVVEKFVPEGETTRKSLLAPTFRLDSIFEAKLTFEDLGLSSGETFGFQLIIKQSGQQVEIFPHTNMIEIEVPDKYFEAREWSV